MLLFADARAGVIGACHAGWKGALTGMIEATIAVMERRGARRADIHVALGPAIGRESYEVGPEFVERFLAEDAGFARFFTPSARAGHAMFDLPAFIAARVAARRTSPPSTICASTPTPTRRAASAIAAACIARSRTTGGWCRRSRSGDGGATGRPGNVAAMLFRFLNWRTWHVAVRAEDATIPSLGLE